MRLPALVAILAAGLAVAGIALDPGTRFEFTDCASGGSASQTVTENQYLLRVTDSDVFLCYAATCVTGGEKLPQGTVVLLQIGRSGATMSCRSSASTGDVILTRAF